MSKRVSTDTPVVWRTDNAPQNQTHARTRELMRDGTLGRKLRRIKGARHAHATIRASGRVCGQEARAALAAKLQRERNLAQQWRVSNVLTDNC